MTPPEPGAAGAGDRVGPAGQKVPNGRTPSPDVTRAGVGAVPGPDATTESSADPAEPQGEQPAGPPAANGGVAAAPAGAKPQRSNKGLIEWGVIIALAVAITIVVRTFAFEAYYIPSASMFPTLKPGDRVLVDKLSYDLHGVHRGDIVVFSRPPTETNVQINDLIKRVIGLPGDTISSGPHGEILINGKPIPQPWLTHNAELSPGPPVPPQTLGPNEYYMLGDNRGDSADSRYIGPISGKLIVGRAVLRVWPFSHIHVF